MGEKGSGIRSHGPIQDFNTLRQECLSRGELFEDPEFPAVDSSLFFSKRPDRYIEWKRPMVINKFKAILFVNNNCIIMTRN